jgi:hypothetical protein
MELEMFTMTMLVDPERDVFIARSHSPELEVEAKTATLAMVLLVKALRERFEAEEGCDHDQ